MASEFDNELETPEMETLAGLADNLVYLLPGCSNLMVRKTLQTVYRDFCRRSCCLCGRRQFTLEPEQDSVTVAPRFGGIVECVAEVTYNGRKLDSMRDYWVSDGTTVRIGFVPRLVPAEGTDAERLPNVDVIVTEMPALNSENVPSWFVQRYGEIVTAGVMARLMIMNGKPWSDPQQAQFERIQYENGVNEARMRYYAGGNATNGDTGFSIDTGDLI